MKTKIKTPRLTAAARNRAAPTPSPTKEPPLEQIASFVGFFIHLLVFKSFFLPLFIIPTGSMAETLRGAHATYTCPNCGYEYQAGFGRTERVWNPVTIQCPHCRWRQAVGAAGGGGDGSHRVAVRPTWGDRIVVHGWPVEVARWFGEAGDWLALKRWNVVVFRNPSQPEVNYIKRLIGLPGEKVQIIDGDIYINDRPATKPKHAQRSLWFPYYAQDFAPKKPGRRGAYSPRWSAIDPDTGWRGLGTRIFRFAGSDRRRDALRFVTKPEETLDPGEVTAVYGYNGQHPNPSRSPNVPSLDDSSVDIVTDVRLSCDVRFEATEGRANERGYVELSVTRYFERFSARFHRSGEVTLAREELAERAADRRQWLEELGAKATRASSRAEDDPDSSAARSADLSRFEAGFEPLREKWKQPLTEILLDANGPIRVSLALVDHRVAVEIDGRTVLEADCETRNLAPWMMSDLAAARRTPNYRHGRSVERLYRFKRFPALTITAANVDATLEHVLIERDQYYTTHDYHANHVTRAGRLEPIQRPARDLDGQLLTTPDGRVLFENCHAVQQPLKLGAKEYFVLGDNSPASQDGRRWSQVGPHLQEPLREGRYQLGTVPADQMIGPAFFVYWPGFLPLWNGGPNLLPDLGRVRWIH